MKVLPGFCPKAALELPLSGDNGQLRVPFQTKGKPGWYRVSTFLETGRFFYALLSSFGLFHSLPDLPDPLDPMKFKALQRIRQPNYELKSVELKRITETYY